MFLIIGGNSEIGRATEARLKAAGEPVIRTTRRPAEVDATTILLDFDQPLGDWGPPAGTTAACIFVAVARLAECEADPVRSERINVERTIALAERLTAAGIYTLFLSTNQVFDGTVPQVRADAPTCPVSAYGRQKARTEKRLSAMMAEGKPIGILRLSKVVSDSMALVHQWKQDLAAGRSVRAFGDMTLAPTPATLVAEAIIAMMRTRLAATAQLTGPRDVTYADLARFIAKRVGASPALVDVGRARDGGMPPGATPGNTTMDSTLLKDLFGISTPDIWDLELLRDIQAVSG